MRAILQFVGEAVRTRFIRHIWCVHWRANAVLILCTAISTSVAMRVLAGIYAVLLPQDTYAQTLAATASMLPQHVFYGSAAIATLGGTVSLLHELRARPNNWNILYAIGHLFAAQFAGIIMYLLSVEWGFSVPFGLVSCGLAGWGGNRTISLLNDRIVNRIFGAAP